MGLTLQSPLIYGGKQGNPGGGGGGSGGEANTAESDALRVYMAGDVPPGLYPWQHDGIEILDAPPPPMSLTFI